MMHRWFLIALTAVFALALAGCSPVMRFHGYAPDDGLLADIEIGRDTRETVAEKIGRPGLTGVMEGSAWYYVQSDWRHEGWRPPVEVKREVVTISFDGGGRVSNIERFGLEQGEVVALSRRVTSPGLTSGTILRQLFSNIGQFNPAQMLGGR
jgi:outer membrane protein assembly factor BamE (lipoprotein component of BamABCDE complex)